jgi:hypothetical protein
MKHGIKMLRELRYKIRMMGIPLSGPTYVYGDNKSQVTNSSRPELTLKKRVMLVVPLLNSSISILVGRSSCVSDLAQTDNTFHWYGNSNTDFCD